MQRVTVIADGFAWNGKAYPSLSQVAFAITGTRWNGPAVSESLWAIPNGPDLASIHLAFSCHEPLPANPKRIPRTHGQLAVVDRPTQPTAGARGAKHITLTHSHPVPNLVVKHWSKVVGFVTNHATPTFPFRLSLRFFLRLSQKIHSHLCNHVAITPDVDRKDAIAANSANDYTESSMTLTIVKLGYAPMLLASKQSKEGLPILGRMFVSIGSGEVARIADDDHASVNANSASVFPTHVFG
jgi:Protein of unknown function (DUF2924)